MASGYSWLCKLVVLTLREYSLKRTVEREAKGAHKDDERQGTQEPADATPSPTPQIVPAMSRAADLSLDIGTERCFLTSYSYHCNNYIFSS